ncbi:Zn(2)-C6 fungal-type DNA-binding domain protein, partial [Metarhizium majus ARSEF 297]
MDASKRRSERLACDRCHGQKLRCTRASGHTKACQRCVKAGEKCTYSPPLRLGRPINKPSQPQPLPHNDNSPDSQSSLTSTSEPTHGSVDHFDDSLASHTSPSMSGIEGLDRRITDLLYPDLQSTPNSSPVSSTVVALSGCDSATLATPSHETDMFDDAFLDSSFLSSDFGQLKETSTTTVGDSRVVDQGQQQQPFAHCNLDDLSVYPANNPRSAPNAAQPSSGSSSTQIHLLRLLSRLQDTPLLCLIEEPGGFAQAIEETAKVSNILLDIMESLIGPMLASPSTDAQCGCKKAMYTCSHAAAQVKDAANTNITVFLTIVTCYVQILQNIQTLSTKLCEIVRSNDPGRTLRNLACIQIGSCGTSLATPAIQASMIAQLLSQLLGEIQKKVAQLSCVTMGYPLHMQIRRGPGSSSFTDIISHVNRNIVNIDAQVNSELSDILQNC